MSDTDSNNTFLFDADRRAIDALIDSGFDVQAVPHDLRDRAGRAVNLLGLSAGRAVAPSAGLADRVLDRISKAGLIAPTFATSPPLALTADHDEPELVPDDEEALDAYVTASYRADKVSSSLRDRAQRLDHLGALVRDSGSIGMNRSLVERTLAAIAAAKPIRLTAPGTNSARVGGFRFADLISLAAAVLLGAAVVWPVLTTVRSQSGRAACGSNMGTVAGGFGAYAGDNREALPMATASFGGPTWWQVGTPGSSNAANLFHLAKTEYVRPADMACPGNPNAERDCPCIGREDWKCADSVSYSYQLMFAPRRPSWGQRQADKPMVILADKSPVVARAIRGQRINPLENSPNHGGQGQWVVRTDGSAAWLSSPQRGDDNIWLPGIIDAAITKFRAQIARGRSIGEIQIRGDELPASESDTFVGP